MTSTGSRIGAAVVGLVLLVLSSIGFLPRQEVVTIDHPLTVNVGGGRC
jgi:hypothetical protein